MMRAHRHRTIQRRIDRLFTSGLSVARRTRLFAEVEECEVCATYYRRHQRLEDALTGTVDGVSPFARERILEVALAGASAENTPVEPSYRRRWVAVGAAAMAAAGAVLLMLMPLGTTTGHRVELPEHAGLEPVPLLAAKGHPASAAADIGIRVFQVASSGDRVDEKHKLMLDDILTFTYTFARPHDGYLALFGIQEEGGIRWYYPDYGEDKSVKIKGDRVDEPLGDGIDLSVNHTPGWLRIVAVFSEQPIDVAAVESEVDDLRLEPDFAKRTGMFPKENFGIPSLQYSVIMEIEEEN